ncbi:MAG: hypothetical protein AB1640_17170 [bacterium]
MNRLDTQQGNAAAARNYTEAVFITEGGKVRSCDPPVKLPSGYYLQLGPDERLRAFVLISRAGFLYKVKMRELANGRNRGYVI